MEEENKTNFEQAPKKHGSKKPLIICLCIILVLAIVAVIVGVVLMKSGKLNFSKKAKLQAGVDQLTESIVKPLDDITNAIEKNDLEVKVLNNISKGDAIGVDAEISASIDNIEVPTSTSSEEKAIEDVKELLNSSTIGFNAQYDGKEKVYGNAKLSMDGSDISVEGLYDGEKAAFRSKELSEKWISMSKKELLKEMGITESELEQVADVYEKFMDEYSKIAKSAEIDEKTSKEIEKRYKDVLKDFINSKEKSIKSEKSKVKVDGKEKSATKLTLSLDGKDIKKLIKNYIETFQKDTQLQGIVEKYLTQYTTSMTSIGEDLGLSSYELADLEQMAEGWDELLKELDTISSQLDSLELDANVKLVVYATNTEVYKTEISLEQKENSIVIATTYSDNKSTTEVSAKAAGQTVKIGTLEIESDNGSGRIKFTADQTLMTMAKMDKFEIECSYKIQGNKEDVNINFDLGSSVGKGTISVESTVNKNEEKSYEGETKISADINVADELVFKGSIKAKLGLTVGSESIPTVSNSDVIDMNDTAAMQKFEEEIQEKAKDLIKKLSSSKAINNIFEDATGDTLEEFIKQLEQPTVTPSVPLPPAIDM